MTIARRAYARWQRAVRSDASRRCRFGLRAGAAVLLTTAGALAQQWSTAYDRPGMTGRVYALREHAGELFAGGVELLADGHELGTLARWDGATWNPVPGAAVDGEVRALATFDGAWIVAGTFDEMGGQPCSNVAAFDGTSWSGLASGLDDTVLALEVYQGELYAGGTFAAAGGTAASGVARWDGTTWNAVGAGLAGTFGPSAWSLLAAPDGRLYVGGQFDVAGAVVSQGVAAWDGTSWSGLDGGMASPADRIVEALAWYAGELHAGGYFSVAGGDPAANVARFDGAQWHPLGAGIPSWSISSRVSSLGVFGGELYVGGNFVQAGPVSSRAVARWDGTQWSSVGGVDGSSLQTTALAMTVHEDRLVVGGEFTRAGSTLGVGEAIVSNSVAAFDGAEWSRMSAGLGFDADVRAVTHWRGGLAAVGSFREAGGSYTSQVAFYDGVDWRFLGALDGTAGDVVELDGDLVVTGDFATVDGQPLQRVARYDGTSWTGFGNGAGGLALAVYQGELYAGGFDGAKRWNGTAWETFGSVVPWVYELFVHSDGKLYIGGQNFSGARVLAWDGTTITTLGSGVNDLVEAFATFQGDLVVGGRFTTAGGLPANNLARWNGSTWTAFGGLTGTFVTSLAVFEGSLYAGGDLALFAGDPADAVARWSGVTWQALAGGLDGTPFTMLADDARGALYVGGLFTRADAAGAAVPSSSFAAWETTPPSLGWPFCFGSEAACPCGNGGAQDRGCDLAQATGGVKLAAAAQVTTVANRATFFAQGYPATATPGAVVIRSGTTTSTAFGDGLRCVGAPLVRLAAGSASGGTSRHVLGHGAGPGAFHYQVWFRNTPDSFCDPAAAFNLSNAVTLSW